MLTITNQASDAIDAIVTSTGEEPDKAGVRITNGVDADGRPEFGIAVAAGPKPDDQVVEGPGNASVFVDAGIVDALDDKILDARVQDSQIGFLLVERS